MKRTPFVLTIVAASLVLATAALAKEPTAATIEGPGLAGPLTIRGSSDDHDGSPLARLVVAAGVGAAMFGHRIPDPTSRTRPPGELGPRYSVTYVVGGPDGKNYRLTGEVYPYATPRPVTYMEPGQSFFPGFPTHGGWFVGGPTLKQGWSTRACRRSRRLRAATRGRQRDSVQGSPPCSLRDSCSVCVTTAGHIRR